MKKTLLTAILAIVCTFCLCFGLAACGGVGTEQGGTEQGGTEQGGTEQGGTEQGGTEQGGTEQGGHTHHYVYVYNNDATCTDDGTETGTCECSEKVTRTKAGTKLGHDMQEVKATDATCTTDGVIAHWHCNRCNLDFEDADGDMQLQSTLREKLGHDMQEVPAKEATCSECGYAAYSACSRCGYTEDSVEYTSALHVKYTIGSRSCSVSGLEDCTDTEIVIPDTYRGLPVTSIKYYAFSACDWLTSIEIPDSVTEIGYNYNAIFGECAKLKTVTLGAKVKTIPAYAFRDCIGLTSIEIPNGVTSIGSGAFNGCNRLESVTIGNGVNSIGNSAFNGCSGLTGDLKIPDSVTEIGAGAFMGCSNLTNVTIGSGVTSIGYAAFMDCSSLSAVYTPGLAAWCKIDFSISYGNPLYYAHHLYVAGQEVTELHIPDGITEIKNSAFDGCNGLESVTIGNSVTSIGDYAFHGCSGLTSIEIPDSVTGIGLCAFDGCSGLESVTIGNGVISIGEYAFNECSNLTSVTIGSSVTSIGEDAFQYCTKLTSIIIPESVTSIGKNAFHGCSNLASVTFENPYGWQRLDYGDYQQQAHNIPSAKLSDPASAAQFIMIYYGYEMRRK